MHLDHATDVEHLEFVLELARQGIRFDSIMVDASHAEVGLQKVGVFATHLDPWTD